MAGYSKTPLWQKLGLQQCLLACVHQPPVDYFEWLADGPQVNWAKDLDFSCRFIHLFNSSHDELGVLLADARQKMPPDAMIWASWPKKASEVPTDITEDLIREVALPLGFVDVKTCAVSEVWSGLKLVFRKEMR